MVVLLEELLTAAKNRLTGRRRDMTISLAMFNEPELHVVKFPSLAEEEQLERDRQRGESRRLYSGRVATKLLELGAPAGQAQAWSDAVFGELFVVRPVEGGDPCSCSCHPRLPDSDLHGYGSSCPCQQTAQERKRFWDEWSAERDAYWGSPEGRAEKARYQAEEDELVLWLSAHPGVVVTQYGGLCPEQWCGSVDGHAFYFRERHDHWRVELDLRPSGHFYRSWKGGDLDDEASYELKESEEGDVIADGTIEADGYGSTPVERARFIVGVIRDHLRRSSCRLHTEDLAGLQSRLKAEAAFCPACGARLASASA